MDEGSRPTEQTMHVDSIEFSLVVGSLSRLVVGIPIQCEGGSEKYYSAQIGEDSIEQNEYNLLVKDGPSNSLCHCCWFSV